MKEEKVNIAPEWWGKSTLTPEQKKRKADGKSIYNRDTRGEYDVPKGKWI